jgi:hypothetical protein
MFSVHPKIKNLSFYQAKTHKWVEKNTAFLELFMEYLILNKYLIMIILVCWIPLSFLDVMKKIEYKYTNSCALTALKLNE